MKIRLMEETDIGQVVELIHRNFDEVMSKYHSPAVVEKFKSHTTPETLKSQMNWKEIYVVEDLSGIIATGALADFGSPEKPKNSISNFFVKPEFHKKSVGRLLFNHLLSRVKLKGVTTFHVPSSRNAVGFYGKMGFVNDAIQPDEADEITWMTMNLEIS